MQNRHIEAEGRGATESQEGNPSASVNLNLPTSDLTPESPAIEIKALIPEDMSARIYTVHCSRLARMKRTLTWRDAVGLAEGWIIPSS